MKQLQIQNITPNVITLVLPVAVKEGDFFYHDFFRFSIDHPSLIISDWQIDHPGTVQYSTEFRTTHRIYQQPFKIIVHIRSSQWPVANAHLCVSYYRKSDGTVCMTSLPIPQKQSTQHNTLLFIEQKNSTINLPNNRPAPIASNLQLLIDQLPLHAKISGSDVYTLLLSSFILAILLLWRYRHRSDSIHEIIIFLINATILLSFSFFPLFLSLRTTSYLAAIYLLLAGSYYTWTSNNTSHQWRGFKNLCGFLCITASIVTYAKMHQPTLKETNHNAITLEKTK